MINTIIRILIITPLNNHVKKLWITRVFKKILSKMNVFAR